MRKALSRAAPSIGGQLRVSRITVCWWDAFMIIHAFVPFSFLPSFLPSFLIFLPFRLSLFMHACTHSFLLSVFRVDSSKLVYSNKFHSFAFTWFHFTSFAISSQPKSVQIYNFLSCHSCSVIPPVSFVSFMSLASVIPLVSVMSCISFHSFPSLTSIQLSNINSFRSFRLFYLFHSFDSFQSFHSFINFIHVVHLIRSVHFVQFIPLIGFISVQLILVWIQLLQFIRLIYFHFIGLKTTQLMSTHSIRFIRSLLVQFKSNQVK